MSDLKRFEEQLVDLIDKALFQGVSKDDVVSAIESALRDLRDDLFSEKR